MSKKEVDQVVIFEKLKEKAMKQKEAVKLLGISLRQIKRKLKAYRACGAARLVHGARGRPSNRRLKDNLKEKAVQIVSELYPDFGPTFATEKLETVHGISLDHETLRLAMIQGGLWKVRQQKRETHFWRERRACYGELVQLDGSPHDWFEGRGPKCTLLAFIDDATSTLLWAEFVEGESTEAVMRATWHYLERYGRPVSLYTDRGGVFKVNLNNPDDERKTQYERALRELEVEHIKARSPQAKGRVERLFGTLQDRLVKELRLAGISTIRQANEFLVSYIAKHNQQFAVEASEPVNLHRSLEDFNLREILCQQEERVLQNDWTIQYKTGWFLLGKEQPTILSAKAKITVREYLDGTVCLSIRGIKLNATALPTRPPKLVKQRNLVTGPKKPWTPPLTHPWRQYKKVTFLNS